LCDWGCAQKKTLHACERDTPRVRSLRSQFRRRAKCLNPRRLLFLDESGVNLAMTRLYGRAPRGERVTGSAPQNYGAGVTLVAVLGAGGVRAAMSVAGPTDTLVPVSFIREVLAPRLRRGDILVMDNLAVHKTLSVREAVRQAGARLLYLPPYSPDLNPIEQCWSKVKASLRKAQARTREALGDALREAFAAVTQGDAKNWFRHCGYA
jgi:transposase